MSICCILALAAIEDMEIHQMDVKTAFLNGDLEEEIYMEQLEGFTQEGEHLVCKLHMSLYGLKQSLRAWNQKLDAFLKRIEFVRSDADFSMYNKWEMSKFSLLSMSMISSWCAIIRTSFLQVKE